MNFKSKFLRRAEKLPQMHSSEFRGIPIVLEWPKGSVRTGKDNNGKGWKRTMLCDYGFVPETRAAGDGEGLDVYIGPDTESDHVYVVEQLDDEGEFDEYKCLLGFPDMDSAFEMYLAHYPDDWEDSRVGEVFEVPFDYAFDAIEKNQVENEGENPAPKTAADKRYTLPAYLYHGTVGAKVQDILANGLMTDKSSSHNEWDGGAVYLAIDKHMTGNYPDHYEAGERESGKVTLAIATKFLNKADLRPDDADFPVMFDELPDEEKAQLQTIFGDAFDDSSWAYCEWPVSLHLTGQVAYLRDIPAKAISVAEDYRGKISNNTGIINSPSHDRFVPDESPADVFINRGNPTMTAKSSGLAYLKALQSMQS
jgi:hypothetical protein